MLFFLHHGLNVTLVVLDRHPLLTHGTFGVPTLVTSVGNNGVMGLALEAGFDRLTLLSDHTMTFAIGTVKVAVTQGEIVGRRVPRTKSWQSNRPQAEQRLPWQVWLVLSLVLNPLSQSTQWYERFTNAGKDVQPSKWLLDFSKGTILLHRWRHFITWFTHESYTDDVAII